MTRLFAAAGVDYIQWRALTRASLLIDYSTLFGADGITEAWRAALGLFLIGAILLLTGLAPALTIWFSGDLLFAATMMTTASACVVAMVSLFQVVTIVAPTDYEVVGFRPVSSRTYFAVRATAVLLQTLQAAALNGLLPVVAFLTRSASSAGSAGSWRLAGAAAAAVGACTLAVTATVVGIYAGLVRRVRPARLARMLAIAQTLILLSVMAVSVGVSLLIAGIDHASRASLVAGATLPHTAWTLLYPATWFASYVEIARGVAGSVDLIGAALSGVLLLALAVVLRGRLSSDYAGSVTEPDSTGTGAEPGAWASLRRERRAMAILLVSQLRGDLAFQVNVLMAVLTGVVFLGVAFYTGRPEDPFLPHHEMQITFIMIQGTLFTVPSSLRQVLTTSAASGASWPFFSTPADRVKLITSARDIIAVWVLLPVLMVIAAALASMFAHVGHALLLTLFLGLMAYVVLQLGVLLDPRMPFSIPVERPPMGQMPAMMLLNLVGLALYLFFVAVVARSSLRMVLGFAALTGTSLLLNRLTRMRIIARGRTLTYIG